MADPSSSALTAMLTPAVLISGAGALILSTSTRLGRATDRVRSLTQRFKELVSEEGQRQPMAREEKRLIMNQLPKLTRRTRYLHRAQQSLYFALALLVFTSVSSGSEHLLGAQLGNLPAIFALIGACILAYGATLLSFESSLSSRTTRKEMIFLEQLGEHYAALYDENVESK